MKRIVEIGTYKSGDSRLEVVDLTDRSETVNEDKATFVGHTTVTGQIKGQNFNDSYQISRTYLRHQSQWRIVASHRDRLAKPDARIASQARSAVR
jgi:hypothetical protein